MSSESSSEDKKKPGLRNLLEAVGKARMEGKEEPITDSGDLFPSLGGREPGEGETLGDFELLREVGRGGMGVIYEAHQKSLKRRVALKVLYPGLSSSEKAMSRFRREAEAVARLSHPGIIPIYAVGEDRGLNFFAMRFLDGPNLAQVIDELKRAKGEGRPAVVLDLLGASHGKSVASDREDTRSTSFELDVGNFVFQAVDLMASIAEALEVAHKAGIIHRDIKPGNLVFDRIGQLVLTDFGIAKTESEVSITRTGEFIGSPAYISPEQAMTRRVKVDHRSDVYSLGVTLYEFLTLDQPFLRPTLEATLRSILTKEPTPLRRLNPKIPKDVETVVLKAMEKDPDRRFGSVAEFSSELRRILNFEAIRVTPVGGMTKIWRQVQRNRGFAVSMVAIGLLAGGLVFLKNRLDDVESRAGQALAGGSPLDQELVAFISGEDRFDAEGVMSLLEQARQSIAEGRLEEAFGVVRVCDRRIELALSRGQQGLIKFVPSSTMVKVDLIRNLMIELENGEKNELLSPRARRIFDHMLQDAEPLVVKNVLVSLGHFGGLQAVSLLVHSLNSWQESSVWLRFGFDMRGDILEALGQTGHPSAPAHIEQALAGAGPAIQMEAVRALTRISGSESRSVLRRIAMSSGLERASTAARIFLEENR
ncbi:MAG TPA: hypothetical protein DDW23_05360 [Planctomycetes bacterium]|nr:hypothetical protein [Planctomycetota bacterium]